MRRFLLAVVFSCACILAQAQEHLFFIGIPIQGTIANFIELLKDKGFKRASSPYSFDGMTVKSVRGTFWKFPDCIISVRAFDNTDNVSSVYIHPKSNYLLKDELIDSYDAKYGNHQEYQSYADAQNVAYIWNTPNGQITIYGRAIYGQSFNILYQDYTEVKVNNKIEELFNNDL